MSAQGQDGEDLGGSMTLITTFDEPLFRRLQDLAKAGSERADCTYTVSDVVHDLVLLGLEHLPNQNGGEGDFEPADDAC